MSCSKTKKWLLASNIKILGSKLHWGLAYHFFNTKEVSHWVPAFASYFPNYKWPNICTKGPFWITICWQILWGAQAAVKIGGLPTLYYVSIYENYYYLTKVCKSHLFVRHLHLQKPMWSTTDRKGRRVVPTTDPDDFVVVIVVFDVDVDVKNNRYIE